MKQSRQFNKEKPLYSEKLIMNKPLVLLIDDVSQNKMQKIGISYLVWLWEDSEASLSIEMFLKLCNSTNNDVFLDHAYAFQSNSKTHPSIDATLGPFNRRNLKSDNIT